MADSNKRMGDIFQERRAAAGKSSSSSPQQKPGMSFLDIQAEQTQGREGGGGGFFRRSPGDAASMTNNSRRARASRGGGPPDRSHLNREQGCIATLKDGFGFIYCADRPEELFFHFSSLKGVHPNDLNVGDEVEFVMDISSRDADKMAAYHIQRLESGTIEWEVEDEPGTRFQGIVERPIRSERGDSSSQMAEGTIRMLIEHDDADAKDKDVTRTLAEGAEKEIAAAAEGPLVRFNATDYAKEKEVDKNAQGQRNIRRLDSSASNSSRDAATAAAVRLGKNDLVEFTLVTERRTRNKVARSIVLLQSDRERQQLVREKQLLAKATLEQGVVASLKTDFGFLRSNRRREEVYFHYSNVELPENEGEGGDEEEFVLNKGQDMEFLVVTEPGRKERVSAREVKVLPKGSVIFHKVIAQGVTGIVTRPPHPVDAGYSSDMVGRVQLSSPVENKRDDGTVQMVDEVLFYSSDAPGGNYSANHDGSSVGLWVQQGDKLLFDLVMDVVDDSYRVAPTSHLMPCTSESSIAECKGKTAENIGAVSDAATAEKAVRLIEPSLAGRAEGVIHAIKEGYGFITCAQRPVDTYFRTYEFLPNRLQEDIRRYMGFGDDDGDFQLKVGCHVQFDLSLQGNVAVSSPRPRSHHGPSSNTRENLKAQRLLLLPPSTIMETKIIAKDAKGIVSKEDTKQSYSGFIELEEVHKPMSLEERYPLVAKLLHSFVDDESSKRSIVYHDLQSMEEDDVVMHMAEMIGKGALACSHIPVAGASGHPGRLCIAKTETPAVDDKVTEESVAGEGIGTPDTEGTTTTPTVANTETGDTPVDKEPLQSSQSSRHSKGEKNKRKRSEPKEIKLVRFDKHCLSKHLLKEIPLSKGDVILCDIVQSRRTGTVEVTNIRVVERSESGRGENAAEGDLGVGVVTEIVPASKFGFISLLDENASKRELLFFQFSSIVSKTPRNDVDSTPSKNNRWDDLIGKGDEVKFDIVVGKKGKRTAINVYVVPRGTLNIPTKASTNACRGFVLMEPSHRALSNTPTRQASRAPPDKGNGRWDNAPDTPAPGTKSGASVKEAGCILLTKDPANMFSIRILSKDPKESEPTSSNVDQTDSSETEDRTEKTADKGGNQDDKELRSSVGTHVSFKTGALAIHGAGVSPGADLSSAPRRGDLVSFVKAKSGKAARDIRVIERGAATLRRGRLERIQLAADSKSRSPGTATFIAATEKEEEYEIDLSEVVSCDVAVLKDKVSVEGILHDNKIYGICRTCDLFLDSKLGSGHKERPKLNLTVRKELKTMGGKIMAQSMMAKGPDGTNGFVSGWTSRTSQYSTIPVDEAQDIPEGKAEQVPEKDVDDTAAIIEELKQSSVQ